MEFNTESKRRSGVRVLRPWLASARLVRLFHQIGKLANRPGALDTVEFIVERLVNRSVDSQLPAAVKNPARLRLL